MSTVFNWQLGREMDYPYEAAYPDHQFAFIFNINNFLFRSGFTGAFFIRSLTQDRAFTRGSSAWKVNIGDRNCSFGSCSDG